MEEYRVELDAYNGPLDLLLHLVRRQEVDVSEVSLARITDDYLRYLDLMSALQVDVAGEFLVMAATLMDIKSRTLLPPAEVEEEDWEDPSEELVRQLMEYRRFKEAAVALEEQEAVRALRVARAGEKIESEGTDGAPAESADVSLWDLLEAFGRLLEATGQSPATVELTCDETPQEVVMDRIMSRFRPAGGEHEPQELPLREFAKGRASWAVIMSLLLAILELVKAGWIRAVQHEPFGEIFLRRRGDAPAGGTRAQQAPQAGGPA